MRIGISIFPENLGYDGALTVALRAEEKGLREVFTVEHGFYNDTVATAMAIAARTERITVGTGIANVYLRHPYALACSAIGISQISGGRFVLGIGVGHPHIATALAVEWHPPVKALRETTQRVREAFRDAPTGPAQGRVFMDAGRDIPVHWAGVGEKVVRNAARHADGLMLYLCSADRLTSIIDAVGEELSLRKRDPSALDVSLLVPTFIDTDLEGARAAAREFLILYCSFPAYGSMFRSSGFVDEMDAIDAALNGVDPGRAKAAISDSMLDEVLLVGSAERIAARLEVLRGLGMEHVLLAPRALDPSETRSDMLRTVDAVSEII
jgi:alkanesulfonate monooxygenase SsuD/methylene tetrahydromethanopterin reductase-like flavin-dependent oxidoreductase (luciferase family)